MSKNQPWKTDRLKSTRYKTEQLFTKLGLEYDLYRSTGCFSIEVGQPTKMQYLCSTGSWGWYEKDRLPLAHENESTLKRFYENVLSQYLDEAPLWKEVRV